MLNEQLDELIQRIWSDTRLRSRLIDNVEETLREFGIESPEELAAWREWQDDHYCACYDDIVKACPCG